MPSDSMQQTGIQINLCFRWISCSTLSKFQVPFASVRMLRSELPVMDATLISTKFCKRSGPFLSKKSSDWAAGLARKFPRSHMFTIVHQTLVFPLCVYDLYICLCVSVRPNRLPAIWPGGWMIPLMANGWKLWKANVFDQCLFLNQWLAGIRCTNCRGL